MLCTLFKKADEGVGDRDRSANLSCLRRKMIRRGMSICAAVRAFRFRQIAAGVMEQVAKCPGWALLSVGGHKKSSRVPRN